MPGKFIIGKHTMQQNGKRWHPIMMKHGTHAEPLVLVRTDEDEHREIVNALCEFLNDAFDQEQLPSELAPHHLNWLMDGADKEYAKHPDFEDRARYVISRIGARFQAHLIDEKTENGVVEVGTGYQSIYHARAACEANLATNRVLRRQSEP